MSIISIVLSLLVGLCLIVSLKSSTDQAENSAAVKKNNEQLRDYVKCQADWTNFFYAAITASRSANAETTAALDQLINSISTAKSTQESEQALNTYKAARTKQLEAQTKNPLPPPPNKVCQLEDE